MAYGTLACDGEGGGNTSGGTTGEDSGVCGAGTSGDEGAWAARRSSADSNGKCLVGEAPREGRQRSEAYRTGRQRRKGEFQKTCGACSYGHRDVRRRVAEGQEGSEQESVQIDDEGTETAGDRGLAPGPPPRAPSARAGVPVGGSRFARCAFRTGPVRFRPALAPRGDLLIAAAGLE